MSNGCFLEATLKSRSCSGVSSYHGSRSGFLSAESADERNAISPRLPFPVPTMALGLIHHKDFPRTESAFSWSLTSGDCSVPLTGLLTLSVKLQDFSRFSVIDRVFAVCSSIRQYKYVTKGHLKVLNACTAGALWRFRIEMQSRNDRKTSFCSERMKLCQKQLAKVYGRSKNIFVRARLGRESSCIHPASAFVTDEDIRSKTSSIRSTGNTTAKVSPYLSAVAGLFDRSTLLRRFQFRNFHSSVPTSSAAETPKTSCPKFCKVGQPDSGSVPVFFETPPVPRPVSHPAPSWASSGATLRQPPAKGHNHKKETAIQVEKNGEDMGFSNSNWNQRSSVRGGRGPRGKTQQRETKSGRPKSRILSEDIGLSKQQETDGESQLGPRINPLLLSNGKVDCSHSWRVLDCSSETGEVQKPAGFGTMVTRYQQSMPETHSASVVPSKKSRLDDTGDRDLYSSTNVVDKQERRSQCEAGFRSRADSAGGDDTTVEASGSSSRRNTRALHCIYNLTPIRTREAHGNYGTDDLSSPSKPLLNCHHEPSEQSGHSCKNRSVQPMQGSHSEDFSLAPPDIDNSEPWDSRQLCKLTVPPVEAVLTACRSEPTHSYSVRDLSDGEGQAPYKNGDVAHLARVTRWNMKSLEKSSNLLWKHGSMAFCTENPVSDYTTGSPREFRIEIPDRKVNWSRSGHRKLANYVCQILRQHSWGPVTVETLDQLKRKLDSHIVNAVLQQVKEPSMALRFFRWAKQREGYKHDVYTYTTMMNILGRARNLSGVRNLLREMHKDGCEPTVVTYNTLILTYGRVKSLRESLRVFRIMKEAGCQPDTITYSTLIHLCVKSRFHQEAWKLYQSMLEEGIPPDTITYSTVIDSLGRSGNLNEARRLFREMQDRGCVPNEFTYNTLIDRHAKLGQTKYALRYFEQMRGSGFPLNPVVCTTMMSVLASLGQYTEAEGMFLEMQQAGIAADTAAYNLMINMWGQAGDLDKAVSWFGRMLSNMVTPSLSTFTSLVNAHLDLHLYEGAQHFLTSMAMWSISPDLKVYTSLLRHCTGCERQGHVDAVLGLMDRLGHPAHKFVFDLLTAKDQARKHVRKQVEKFFDSLQHEDQDSKQAFANALIEFLHKLQCKTDPGFVWEIAMEKGLFPAAIIRREAPNHWLIDLHSLSVGTALVALPRLLLILRDSWVRAPTKRVYIVTGWGKRSRVTGSSSMKKSVNELLQSAKSPFSIDHTNAGVFVSYGVPFSDWISVPLTRRILGLDVITP